MKFSKSKQSGFTLVEIAIVLVIIGVLLAGVLKGQSLINNSRIKGLVGNLNAVSSAYNGFLDRYQVSPGTETIAKTATRGWVTSFDGTAPLNLAALPRASTFVGLSNDQIVFWQELKAAGFFVGNPADTTAPPSATGGLIGVTWSAYIGATGVSGCLSGVAPQLAEGVDIIVDGPIPTGVFGSNTGSLRGTSNANPPLAPNGGAGQAISYNENSGNFWTLCRGL